MSSVGAAVPTSEVLHVLWKVSSLVEDPLILHNAPLDTRTPPLSCQMKAEMVRPGAVVYTAALAECRWAGEREHVDYLLQEMKAEGLRIVPGTGKDVFDFDTLRGAI